MQLMKYLLLFILFSLSHTTNRNILQDHFTIQKEINASSDDDVVVISEYIYNDTSNISQAAHPFNFIEISIQLTQNINHNTFYQFYESQNGLKTSITTPFYWGDIQASIHLLPYFGKEQNYVDFIGIHQNLKWGKKLYFSNRIRWFNGMGIGWYIFYLTDKVVSGQIESELSTGFLSQAQYSINKNINLNIEINIDRIFTYKTIDLVHTSMGISYLFKTPDWMRLFIE
jgi:hypothetical protein